MVLLSLLIFVSGAAALIYQTLWMRMFLLVFGNTAYAAAAVLAGFLLGLGLGYLVVGRRSAQISNPLRVFAWLELATGLAAVPVPWLLSAGQAYYPEAYAAFGSSVWSFTALKAVLALALMLPATFCMGGTFPILGEAVVADSSRIGIRAAVVYGVNTLGGMSGCLAAAFWLPAVLGVRRSYELAVTLNLLVGIAAWGLSRGWVRPVQTVESGAPVGTAVHSERQLSVSLLDGSVVLAGVAGFCGLGLEVLWTRMFAQVLQNSVYSYAAIVVTVLAGLGLAALLVAALSTRPWQPGSAVLLTTLGAGLFTGLSPLVFYVVTNGLSYQWAESWVRYLVQLFGLASLVIGPAVVLGGMTLPLTWRLWEQNSGGVGAVLGRLAAINTFSAVAGALIAGFVLLPAIGLWRSIFFMTGAWCVASVLAAGLTGASVRLKLAVRVVGTMGFAFLLGAVAWTALPLVTVDSAKGETLLAVREGSHGIVAVVDRPSIHDRRIKVDNYYTLGGLASRDNELLQGQLPLLLHPSPQTVLHIGSATGISPAGALSFPVKRVVAVELIPEVTEMARIYFADANRHIYDDPRVGTVIADGRNYLLGTRERFDVIIADLFIPWHAGAGYLYSQEQFALAKSRLADGGLFCLWLPLYQLSPDEFRMIVATFLRVFPQTTLWRGDFYADKPIVALVGHPNGQPINLLDMEQRLRRLRESGELRQKIFRDLAGVLMLYAGNLSVAANRYTNVPINTDDRPLLEYLAPRIVGHQGHAPVKGKEWFIGSTLASFYRELHADILEKPDPIFPDQALRHRQYRMAGEFFYNFNVLMAMGQTDLARKSLEHIVELVPEGLYRGDNSTP